METFNIAAVTDDGSTISKHFGKAKYYIVIYVENNKVIKKETRAKLGHQNFANVGHHQSDEVLGLNSSSHKKHLSIAETIKDCSYVITGGMGTGAYYSIMGLNIKPILTDIKIIDDAVRQVIDGTIINHTEYLH